MRFAAAALCHASPAAGASEIAPQRPIQSPCMEQDDFSDLLRRWPHEPGRINARVITGLDGREKIQVRLELGVLQMEMEGRPDGNPPRGHDCQLARHRAAFERYVRDAGMSTGFVLSADDCRELREEAVQFYHRYVALFALHDYQRVVRDTTHNLELLDLCRNYAAEEYDRTVLEQFRPSLIMMRTRAEADMAIADKAPRQALAALDRGLNELREAFDEAGRGEEFQDSNEAQLLRGMRDALIPKLPVSQRGELEERLHAALAAENYELAAILRDELRIMKE